MKANYTVEVWSPYAERWYVRGRDEQHLCIDRALKLARSLVGTYEYTTRIVRQLYGRPVVWHSEEDY